MELGYKVYYGNELVNDGPKYACKRCIELAEKLINRENEK
jgi:hypothetical protein